MVCFLRHRGLSPVEADVAPSLFGWVGFLVKLPKSRSSDVIACPSVTLWMCDTSRAFRLSHLTQGSSTRQGQPKKCISAQRDMMYLKGGLFVFETKMTLDRS